MKVTLFQDLHEEGWTSMQIYARELGDSLEALGKPEVKLVRYQPRATTSLRFFEPLFRYIPYLRFYGSDPLFSRLFKYPLAARFHQGDINHIIDHSYAHLLRSLDARRTVVTVHDLIPIIFDQTPVGQPKNKYLRTFESSIANLKDAAFLIADSKSTKQDLVEHLGCSPERIRVVHLGVNPLFRPLPAESKQAFRAQRNLGAKEKLVLHIGHNEPYKNIENIISSLAILRDAREVDFLFVKIGKDFTKEQKELISDYRLDRRVIYLGKLAPDEIVDAYNAADLLLLPSLYEGFGFPVLEALACGTPVVSSRVASLPEVGGEAVFWVDPRDPRSIAAGVYRVLVDTDLRHSLYEKGFIQAKKFTWEKTALETLGIYQKVYRENSSH